MSPADPDRPGRGGRHRPARHVDRAGLPARRARGAAHRRLARARAHGVRARRRPAADARGPAAAGRGRGAAGPSRRGDRRARWTTTDAVRHRRRQREDRPARGGGRAPRRREVRRRPPDGRQRALRAAGGERGPLRRPALGDHAAPAVRSPTPSRWSRSWSRSAAPYPVRLSPEEHDRAVARTSHVPHLLAALVAGPPRRGARRTPRADRAGRPRRDPGGGRATRRSTARS